MKTFVILPARMKSSRLPNKLIKKIGKMTLIEHMITRAKNKRCNNYSLNRLKYYLRLCS